MSEYPKLKDCPHCGCPVTLERTAPQSQLYVFRCPDTSPCMGSGFGQYAQADKLDAAVAIWNTRA